MFVSVLIAVSVFVCESVFSGEYDSCEKRDPFVPLVGVEGRKNVSDENVFTIDNVVFQGVAFDDKGEQNAIINGELMGVGEKMGEMEIKHITEEYVSVRIGEKTYKLKLYE